MATWPALRTAASLLGALALSSCASTTPLRPTADFTDIGYSAWTNDEPPYRVYPGDELDIQVPSAPELSKTVVVQPDGRVSLPLVHAVMVADHTTSEVEGLLSHAYATQLLRPEVIVAVKTAQPVKVFVGGEVDKPGVYDMPGDINALQAVIQAGGFKSSGRRDKVVIIRRGPEGKAMMRTVNLVRGVSDPGATDLVPLRRFDVVYVPRSGLSEGGVLMGQLRDLLPGQLGFSYLLNNASNAVVLN
jgi:polysaccharide export outer membrane protein